MTQNINNIVQGMTNQEKAVYFSHLEKNTRYELDKVEMEKQRLKDYKASLIEDIINWTHGAWTREELQGKTTRTLERIYDNC